jgi:signal transduction histidine kinase
MSTAWARPLRRQLVLVIALLVAPTILAVAWLVVDEFRETSDELAELTQATAIGNAAAIERELIGLDRMALNLTSHPAVQNVDPAAVALLRPQRMQRPSLLDLALVDREGRLVARGGASDPIDDRWSDVIARVLHHGKRVVSTIQPEGSARPYVAVMYPVKNTAGVMTGALAYYIAPQLLQNAIDQRLLPDGSIVAIIDRAGRVLARNLESERYVGRILDVDLSDAPQPPWQDEAIDGVRRMFGQALVQRGPWIVTVGIPMSVATDRAMAIWLRTFPVLGLSLGAWMVIAFVFSRRLTRSVGYLESAAQRIAAGDFGPIEPRPMPTREFAELQNAFDQMLLRFNDTRRALDTQMAEERRMRQEVESLQHQIIRQERLAAVGQLVSGVAHEINNPLQAILGFSELLQMQNNVPETVKNDLLLIQKESARACGIIRNLAMFARQQTGEAEPVRLLDVVRAVAELRQRRIESEGIELHIDDRSVCHVAAVITELQQVVLNFVVNAEQAIVASGRRPGRITVRTFDRDAQVVLEVEDTGPGVPPDHEARLFQPFFTTKPVGQGTGLGLSVSYGIIDSLGGHIGYRSAPSGGAVFYFELPAAPTESALD